MTAKTRQNGAARFTAARVAEVYGGRLLAGRPETAPRGVSTDTRTLEPGQAFFALRGPRHDGHDYLDAAAAAGARLFVVERRPPGWTPPAGGAVVEVADTERALLALAAWHRRRLRAAVAAVTGSYGKSTVKDMLGAILGLRHRCTVAPASFNNRIGVARTLLAATADDEFVVLEMGTNHPGEIDELARAAGPDVGVITAIGPVHLEGLGSLEGVREAKAELIDRIPAAGALVLNADDAPCASLAGRYGGLTCTFGFSDGATLRCSNARPQGQGWAFELAGRAFSLPVPGRFNVLNAAAAARAALCCGVCLGQAARALAKFRPPPMRYERLTLGDVLFVRDCYNSNPPAMRAAFESFMLEANPGRKVVVCGDMLELGAEGPELHRALGRDLAAGGADMLVGVGPLSRHVVEGWHSAARPPQTALWFASAEQAWRPLWWHLDAGDAVLLKGSRLMRLETITERIAAILEPAGKEAAA